MYTKMIRDVRIKVLGGVLCTRCFNFHALVLSKSETVAIKG